MTQIDIGGIYRAVPMDPGTPAALVLVTALDGPTQSLTVTLLSPDVELGTSEDLFLRPEDTNLAYALLAESDIFGYVWVVQLDRQLGRVDSSVVEALTALGDDDAVDLPNAGPPVVERSDPRWNFKLHELKRLQSLTSHCTRELIDGERMPSIDPNALRAPVTDAEVAAFEEFVVEVVEGISRGDIQVPGWLVDIALDENLIEAYRAVGLYNSLRLLWKMADTTDLQAPLAAAPATLSGYLELQVEMSSSAGYSSLRLLGRSTDIQGPIEARLTRTRDGRLLQLSLVSAAARVTKSREVYA
jgi:hypothetical protein